MGSLAIERTNATLGAIVRGVDLSALAEHEWRAVEDAFLAHAVLIFPEQRLSATAQQAFAERFGTLEWIVPGKGVVPITNLRRDGRVAPRDDRAMQVMLGNEGWHTDSSYMPISAKASVLSAHVVPSAGGGTEWADARAAWDELDATTRRRVGKLSAHHSLRYSQTRAGLTQQDGYGMDVSEPPLRPLVKVHPVTGRRALYIGRHAHAIPGLTEHESQELLDELLAFTCQPPRVYEHRWRPGDVAIWDNRSLLHRAKPFDIREPRLMKHTRISGDPASERAVG